MVILQLPRLVERSKKRLGRGHGSGKGKTAGRGTKGQKARGTVTAGFEGGQSPLARRMPYLRGKGVNHSPKQKPATVVIKSLNLLVDDSVVSLESLRSHNIIDNGVTSVKLVAGGTLIKKLNVQVPCSGGAKKAIEKAGGSVTV